MHCSIIPKPRVSEYAGPVFVHFLTLQKIFPVQFWEYLFSYMYQARCSSYQIHVRNSNEESSMFFSGIPKDSIWHIISVLIQLNKSLLYYVQLALAIAEEYLHRLGRLSLVVWNGWLAALGQMNLTWHSRSLKESYISTYLYTHLSEIKGFIHWLCKMLKFANIKTM